MKIKLIPFEPSREPALDINVIVERQKSRIDICFVLSGDTESIVFPAKKSRGKRVQDLWKTTCFEAFFSFGDNPFYWELNFSPSGDWNFFFLENYRLNLKEEVRIKKLKQQNKANSQSTQSKNFEVSIDLAPILKEDENIKLCMGLTAVIEKKDQTKSYWAVNHLGSKPDFHLRKSFSLEI